MIMINLENAVLIACGNPSIILKLTAPLLPAAIVCHLIIIPIFGSTGAAAVTTATAAAGAVFGLISIKRRLQIILPIGTLMRALLLSGMVFLLMRYWHVHGILILAPMTVSTILTVGGFLALGELRRDEISFFQALSNQIFFSKQ
jgi:hypothetical protein